MKIKKYEARTEQEAIKKIKEELGLTALILNIKKVQPRGLFAIFKKPTVEITAAYDEKTARESAAAQSKGERADNAALAKHIVESVKDVDDSRIILEKDKKIIEQQSRIVRLENQLNNTEDLLEKVVGQLGITKQEYHMMNSYRRYENNLIQIFFDALVEQGVTEDIAVKILDPVNNIDDTEKINVELLVKIVYNTLLNVMGEPEVNFYSNDSDEKTIIAYIGPTGVGKTTTIAKMSSNFILKENCKVGLITADTYRIAAVEQLKTYAEILGINVEVVFNSKDLLIGLEQLKKSNDVVLIDTAGRSHKNQENLKELNELLMAIPNSHKFLVLSITTKYEDLMNIINAYSSITDFSIIFTKLDETTRLGSILNICYTTGKKISFITNGQNVPEDIDVVRPDKIAKALLGLGGGSL